MTLKYNFHIIFIVVKLLLLFPSQPFKNVQNIPSSRAVHQQAGSESDSALGSQLATPAFDYTLKSCKMAAEFGHKFKKNLNVKVRPAPFHI